MRSTELADATARALDLLPPGDPARSDPRMLRDSRLSGEARLTRETAADVWLAVSPLCVAPPEILQAVLAEINAPEAGKLCVSRRALPWLAAGGWAAAAAVTLLLWPRHQPAGIPASAETASQNPAAPRENAPIQTPSSRDQRQRSEIHKLRQQLVRIGDDHTNRLPRIIGLKPPGAADHTPAETRSRIRLILADALRSSLEAESGAPSDPATTVIERGWPKGGVPAPAEGEIIRHRNFPELAWRDLGFLRSADGGYYDSANHTIWSASPDGRGFTGRRAGDAEDLARFTHEVDTAKDPPPRAPRTAPEGFIVENPDDNTADVIIDQLPVPAEGNQYFVKIGDSSGNTRTISVTPETKGAEAPSTETVSTPPDDGAPQDATAANPLLIASNSNSPYISYGTVGPCSVGGIWPQTVQTSNVGGTPIVTFNIGNIGNLASFQVVERPLVPNGQPDTIIIESHP